MLQYLVRHGESVSNVEGRVQGQLDVDLTPLGVEQADRVGRWFASAAGPAIDEVWSSPLLRARRTAGIVAAALGLPVRLDERLKELDAGIFQGLLWAELHRIHPEAHARWVSGDPDYAIPGGESRRSLAERGAEVLTEIAARPAAGVIVVAHGGILTHALRRMANLDAALGGGEDGRRPAMANAAVSVLEWPGPELVSFNATAHLD
jgi:probable phosphoglycerate mutase